MPGRAGASLIEVGQPVLIERVGVSCGEEVLKRSGPPGARILDGLLESERARVLIGLGPRCRAGFYELISWPAIWRRSAGAEGG
jgi:hypothetical protein